MEKQWEIDGVNLYLGISEKQMQFGNIWSREGGLSRVLDVNYLSKKPNGKISPFTGNFLILEGVVMNQLQVPSSVMNQLQVPSSVIYTLKIHDPDAKRIDECNFIVKLNVHNSPLPFRKPFIPSKVVYPYSLELGEDYNLNYNSAKNIFDRISSQGSVDSFQKIKSHLGTVLFADTPRKA